MVEFAGWEMPVQYAAGILAEHRAVRTAAGLFDISHMSVLEVTGADSAVFLDRLLANRVARLHVGRAQYSCILDSDGGAVDDVFLYRTEGSRFLLVANAANAQRVVDWIGSARAGKVDLDTEIPPADLTGDVRVRDLRQAGEESLVLLALQGPASLDVLQSLAGSSADRDASQELARNAHVAVELAFAPVRVTATGYTGEAQGFELFVHPDRARGLWDAILDAGLAQGVLAAGLGARDSTRIEAGLPLFGHEIEGNLGISMTEAGYGWVVKLDGPPFIGRTAYADRVALSRRHLLRLRGRGRKTVRPGHAIVDDRGRAVGQVTSFAYVHEDMTFIALVCVDECFQPEPGDAVRGARIAPGRLSGPPPERSIVQLTALKRFPGEAEKDGWPDRYR